MGLLAFSLSHIKTKPYKTKKRVTKASSRRGFILSCFSFIVVTPAAYVHRSRDAAHLWNARAELPRGFKTVPDRADPRSGTIRSNRQPFGRWPSFHDAEIVRMNLERKGDGAPYLEAEIYVFDMTTEIDDKGYYILQNKTLVTFRFTHIVLEYLKWFNIQNVLWDLEITEIKPEENDSCNFRVEMPSSYGCEAAFNCRDILITKAEPYKV